MRDKYFTGECGKVGNLTVSYNPDDKLWYVSLEPNGTDVIGRFAERRNAIQFARRKMG